jgi:hypothetical protein
MAPGGGDKAVGILYEWIKNSISVLESVSQYMDFRPTTQGGIGLCPFHENHIPRFGLMTKRTIGIVLRVVVVVE